MRDGLQPAQIRGARAMLDWSLMDLAKAAGLSVMTVKRAQDGLPAEEPLDAIRRAFEAAGVCFLSDDGDGSGVRLKSR